MRQFFAKNLLFILTVNILVKTVYVFMIDRAVQNRVGHAAYGTYQALLNLCIIFQTLDLAITNYNINTISQNPGKLKSSFSSMLSAKLVMMLAYAAVIFTLAAFAGYNRYEFGLLGGIFVIQTLTSLVLYVRSNIASLQHFRKDSVLSAADKLLMIFLCGGLLYSSTAASFNIEWFIGCQILSYLAAALASFYVLYKISGIRPALSSHIAGSLAIIKKSLPYALLIFLMSVYTRTDAILIERLCGSAGKLQTGIYAAGFRLLDVSNNMLGVMFAGILLPLFGRMLAERQDVKPIITLSVNILLPVSFMVTMATSFFGADIMKLLYHNTTAQDGAVLAWLMAAFPAFCMMYIYSTLLTANKSLKLLNIIAFIGVVVNLSLNFYFIPKYGALAAAIIAFITQSTVALCSMFFAARLIKGGFNVQLVSAHLGFMLFAAMAGYGIKLLPLWWIWQLLLFGALCMLTMFVFKFVSIQAFGELLKRKKNR